MEDSRVEVSSLGFGGAECTEGRSRRSGSRVVRRERGLEREWNSGGEEGRRERVAAVKRTVHHWAQERKHCTLSANKPGFVVISSCGARVEPAQHTDAYTRAVGHCANASALEHTHNEGRERERRGERKREREREREKRAPRYCGNADGGEANRTQ